ncbi:acyltransferase 3 [Leptodontidium sp. MPI-SDFR-AT-0119]|nr:acyltransferase 3 [Leptodontidium sp. MPI-SDFR-AT-0119]
MMMKDIDMEPPQRVPSRSQLRAPRYGLRGLFSFLVFVRHFLLPWVKDLDTGYDKKGSTNLLKLPIVRVLYSGPTVAIFFVVSGFVISSKPLRFIRRKDFAAMSTAMISSVFRRGLRLFLPPIISTFLVAIVVHLGWYDAAYEEMPGDKPRHPARYEFLVDQLSNWLRFVMDDLTHPWSWKSPRSEYDSHLWTIPIQFRASMIVFLALLGLARTKPKVRSCCLLLLAVYSLQQKKWPVALFLAGVMMAEWNLNNVSERAIRIVLYRASFIIGLYLGSYPRAQYAGPASLGFIWLSQITDDDRYWQAYGAILLLWSISKDRVLQRLLTGSLLRYLGNISFSLYLVHGPVLHLFGYSLVPYVWELTGSDTTTRSQLGIGLSLIALTPIVLWVADVFWRLVDKPCGVLVARVESMCFV